MATPQPELNYYQDQSHEGHKHHLLLPFNSKDLTKLTPVNRPRLNYIT